MARLKLFLFGSFQLVRDEHLVSDFRSDKARALLAYLVLEGREAITRKALYSLLWDGYTLEAAQSSLRTTLSNLRKILEPFAQLHTTHHTVQFVPSAAFWCDALALVDRAAGAEPNEDAAGFGHVQRSKFLLGFETIDSSPFLQWRQQCQEQFEQRLKAFQQTQSPSSPQVRRNDWPHALPRLLTPLIGRTEEVQRVVEKVLHPEYPLVILVGEGGVGKTRLALAAANQIKRHWAEQLPDGVWFVSLVGVLPNAEPAEQLAEAVGRALQLSFAAGEARCQQVIAQLRGKQLLLIVDNFEGWNACVPFLLDLLHQATQLKLLITSRQLLHIQAEYPILVTGLPTPPEWLAGDSTDDWSELLRYASVQLFVERARRIRPTFEASAQTAQLLAQICQTVAGLPLAIELAAAQVRHLTCQQICDALDSTYTLLATDLPDLPLHHRSLQTVFERSWQMLTPLAQQVFAELAVFTGAFDLEAAQAVTQQANLLSDLVDCSLVTPIDEQRYEMHSLLRQFATDKLHAYPQGEVMATYARHSHHYLSTARQLHPLYYGQQPEILWQWMHREGENLRAAWQFAVDHAQIDLLTVGVQVMGLHYSQSARFQEGVHAFQQALRAVGTAYLGSDEGLKPPVKPTTLLFCDLAGELGMLLTELGRFHEAIEVLREAVDRLQPEQNLRLAAFLYTNLGICYVRVNHPDQQRVLEQAVDLAQQSGEAHTMARAREHLASYFLNTHTFAKAIDLFRKNLELARQLQMRQDEIHALIALSVAERSRLNYPAARRAAEEVLALTESLTNWGWRWVVHHNLAFIALRQSHFAQAEQLHTILLGEMQSSLTESAKNAILHNRAEVALRLGHFEQAAAWLGEVEAWLMEPANHSRVPDHLTSLWLTYARLHYGWGHLEKSYEYAQRTYQLLGETPTSIWYNEALMRLGYAALHCQADDVALRAFENANRHQQAAYANELCQEAAIASAYLWMREGQADRAHRTLTGAIEFFAQHWCFDACEEPIEMLLLAYEVFRAVGNTTQAQWVIEAAARLLDERIAHLPPGENPQRYLASRPIYTTNGHKLSFFEVNT